MPSDCLTFAQGQTATLTAQFVTTPAGMPVNVPDATIEIFGSGGAVILAPQPMTMVVTGLYAYVYAIPNSLPVDTYTVRFTGTVLGTPTAGTLFLRIVAAGSPLSPALSATAAEAAAALERYISCAQRIPVEAEVGKVNSAGDVVHFSWPRWNLTNAIIKKNDTIIDTGFSLDYDTGVLTFSNPLHPTDIVDASYNWRWFSQEELIGFLNDALNVINLQPSGSSFTLDNLPDQVIGVLLHGAAANALQALMFCLKFQKPATVFGGQDRADKAFADFETLKQNHLKIFDDGKRLVKITRWPSIAATVAPEFTLPGGRSRWFRFLFSTNIS